MSTPVTSVPVRPLGSEEAHRLLAEAFADEIGWHIEARTAGWEVAVPAESIRLLSDVVSLVTSRVPPAAVNQLLERKLVRIIGLLLPYRADAAVLGRRLLCLTAQIAAEQPALGPGATAGAGPSSSEQAVDAA